MCQMLCNIIHRTRPSKIKSNQIKSSNIFLTMPLPARFHQNCQAAFGRCWSPIATWCYWKDSLDNNPRWTHHHMLQEMIPFPGNDPQTIKWWKTRELFWFELLPCPCSSFLFLNWGFLSLSWRRKICFPGDSSERQPSVTPLGVTWHIGRH